MNLGFNRLKVFFYVYREGSAVGAARALHVTQPAISQHLKKLEMEVATPLFTRVHRRLVPTAAGNQLYELVSPFVVKLEAGLRAIHRSLDEPYGLVRLGAPVEFGQRYLPKVFAEFRELHPEVTFHLELGHPSKLLAMLQDGQLDFTLADVFSDARANRTLFDVQTVFEESLILVGSPRLVGRVAISEAPFIAYRRHAPSLRSWFRRHVAPDTPANAVKIALTVESVAAAIEGAVNHLGLAVVPSHLVSDALSAGTLVEVQTETAGEINRISIVQLQDKIPTLTERTFIKFCRGALAF